MITSVIFLQFLYMYVFFSSFRIYCCSGCCIIYDRKIIIFKIPTTIHGVTYRFFVMKFDHLENDFFLLYHIIFYSFVVVFFLYTYTRIILYSLKQITFPLLVFTVKWIIFASNIDKIITATDIILNNNFNISSLIICIYVSVSYFFII